MNSNFEDNERKETIAQLQKRAQEVLSLKKEHRQKRPIVIEFSGSPKSGKTSCINSLEFFLKRNGFIVEIVHERANVCPVYNKKSPMFNIWTACAAIMGMLSVLEKKEAICDVLILDRGIFDAFCWFDWLTTKKKMENDQRKIVESFLSMDLIINRIDIVFAFTASPHVSIKREYAHLLTDKPGTIMNKRSLGEYLSSMKRIYSNKKQYFHEVFNINTTYKLQDDVSKEVTEKTLDQLKYMLLERIGFIMSSPSVLDNISKKRCFSIGEMSLKNYFGNIIFEQRKIVESKKEWLQLVPIVVITDKKHTKVLAVKKGNKAVSLDSPEKDKILLYVGGHIRAEDSTDINSNDLLLICRYTLRREIKEEIGESVAIDNIKPLILYTPDTLKSSQHIGICFLYETNIDDLKLQLNKEELTLNRGTSKSGQFHDVKKLSHENGKKFESWSVEIAKHFFGINIKHGESQRMLFDID
jgi:8-oxo-dGTP pyrophosphatase MutT (NUDIX family)